MDKETLLELVWEEVLVVMPELASLEPAAEHRLDDMGFDSLQRVQLVSRLEDRLEIELPDHAPGSLVTISDVRNDVLSILNTQKDSAKPNH
ncbi:acyl carrier protein [Streptomyces zaomyceticus]|uniref:acyl carrier protein n=1 Tax=Streptomyces zaomyceticus TaxID=68286 RepID=UPI0036B9017B